MSSPATSTAEKILQRKFIGIKQITISEEENEKLEKFLKLYTRRFPYGTQTLAVEKAIKDLKYHYLKKVTGICTQCSNLAEYQVSYDVNGASLIQRYCGTCLDGEKAKGNIERDY